MVSQPTFGLPSTGSGSLTTPVNYLANKDFPMLAIPADPFAPVKGAPLCYYLSPDSKGWILWSAGPDRKYDLTAQNIGIVYKPIVPPDLKGRNPIFAPALAIYPKLIFYTYDPTNGTKSGGDVFRVDG